jgi:HEAT repeat protein
MAVNGILKFRDRPEELRELLSEAAESDNPRLRTNATKVIGLIDKAASLEVAQRSLEDRDARVRLAAVKSLAKIHSPQAIEPLKRALDDEDINVVLGAAFALSDTGKEGAEVLKTALAGDNMNIATCAAHALVEIGDTSGIHLVINALNDDGYDIWHTPFLLSESGDRRAVDALLKFVEDSLHAEDIPSKALRAIRALRNCPEKRSVDMLKKVMHTRRDRKARGSAMSALLEMGTEEAVDSLLEALISTDGNLRQHARNAVVKMGSEVLPRLEALLEEVAGKPRRAVEAAMEWLKTRAE